MNTSQHLFWITSRAAGSAALVTASVSVAFGILMSSRRSRSTPVSELRPVHEALSLATLALVALHGVALLGDRFLHPGVLGITIPLVGPYRPAWTGIGIVAGYGLAALGLTYYLRDAIGAARWRRWHRYTALFWLLGLVHTVGSGSDRTQAWFLLLVGPPVVCAGLLVAGRVGRGFAGWLELPRTEPPVRQSP